MLAHRYSPECGSSTRQQKQGDGITNTKHSARPLSHFLSAGRFSRRSDSLHWPQEAVGNLASFARSGRRAMGWKHSGWPSPFAKATVRTGSFISARGDRASPDPPNSASDWRWRPPERLIVKLSWGRALPKKRRKGCETLAQCCLHRLQDTMVFCSVAQTRRLQHSCRPKLHRDIAQCATMGIRRGLQLGRFACAISRRVPRPRQGGLAEGGTNGGTGRDSHAAWRNSHSANGGHCNSARTRDAALGQHQRDDLRKYGYC